MTYDLENKMERKFFKDELLRSNDFLEYTKELLWRGRVAAHKRGCYLARTAPYGYRKIIIGKDHTLEIIEDQADVVRMVFDLYVNEDKTPYQIACRLNDAGISAPKGGKWSRDTIRFMLRNPHYAGYVAFNRTKRTPVMENGQIVYKHLAQPEEEQIIAEGKQEAIISRDVWTAAQEITARHPKVNIERETKNPYAGVIFCQKCGRALALHPYKHAEDRFTCKQRPPCYKSIRVGPVHEALLAALEEAELPALEMKVKNGDGDARKIQQRLLVKLEKQMEEYRAQEERQYDLLETNPNYSQEVFDRRNKALREKMGECQEAIYKAKSALPQSVDYAERVIALKNAIEILKDPKATPAEQNRVVKAIIERIEYSSVPSDQGNRKRLRDGDCSPFELRITLRL